MSGQGGSGRLAVRGAAAPVVHALFLRQGGVTPRRIPLGDAPLRIGSGPANELVLPSPDISHHHCRLGVIGGLAVITDLRSEAGIFVGGERVDGAASLQPGAAITIGPFTLIYSRGSAAHLGEVEAAERERATALGGLQALLPAPLQDGPVRAAWCTTPSTPLSGTAFGYRWLDGRSLAMFLLDVPGHGVGAATQAAAAARLLGAPEFGADPADPASVLRALNAALRADDQAGRALSLWYGVYDHPSRSLRFATAAHRPAYLRRGTELIALATRGPALGAAPRARFGVAEAAVPPNARLFLCSRGLAEGALADGSRGLDHVLAGLRERDAEPGPAAAIAAGARRGPPARGRPRDPRVRVRLRASGPARSGQNCRRRRERCRVSAVRCWMRCAAMGRRSCSGSPATSCCRSFA